MLKLTFSDWAMGRSLTKFATSISKLSLGPLSIGPALSPSSSTKRIPPVPRGRSGSALGACTKQVKCLSVYRSVGTVLYPVVAASTCISAKSFESSRIFARSSGDLVALHWSMNLDRAQSGINATGEFMSACSHGNPMVPHALEIVCLIQITVGSTGGRLLLSICASSSFRFSSLRP